MLKVEGTKLHYWQHASMETLKLLKSCWFRVPRREPRVLLAVQLKQPSGKVNFTSHSFS